METVKLEIPKDLWDELETSAAINEVSGKTFALGLLSMGASMAPAVWPSLTRVSFENNVPEALVLQNCVIKYLAQHLAWGEMNPDQEYPIPEFIRRREGGIMTGPEYLDRLVDFFKGQNQWGKQFMREFSLKKHEDLVKYPPESDKEK